MTTELALSSPAEFFATFHDQFDGELIETIDARTLHEFLSPGRDFATWLNSRVEELGFVENQDFARVEPRPPQGGKLGRPRIDYHVTFRMAYHLAVIERNDRGRQCRDYFYTQLQEAHRRERAHLQQLREVNQQLELQVAERIRQNHTLHLEHASRLGRVNQLEVRAEEAERKASQLEGELDATRSDMQALLDGKVYAVRPEGYAVISDYKDVFGRATRLDLMLKIALAADVPRVTIKFRGKLQPCFHGYSLMEAYDLFIVELEQRGGTTWYSPLLQCLVDMDYPRTFGGQRPDCISGVRA